MTEYFISVPEIHYNLVKVEADSMEDAAREVEMWTEKCIAVELDFSHAILAEEKPWHVWPVKGGLGQWWDGRQVIPVVPED